MRMSVKSSRPFVLSALLVGAAVMTFLSPASAGRVRGLFHWAIAPLGDAGMYFVSRVKTTSEPTGGISPSQARELKRQNEILRRRQRLLAARLAQLDGQIESGRTVISRLFGRSQDVPVKLIPARVVAEDSLPYGWCRLINAGQKQGVSPGLAATTRTLLSDRSEKLPKNLAVLSGQALVGRVVESSAYSARLQLLTDRGYRVGAQVHRVINPRSRRTVRHGDRLVKLTPQINRPVNVLACGDGAGGIVAREVRLAYNIQPGDRLQTHPDSPELPVAVEIGTVARVLDDPKHPGMVTLEISPTADLPPLREVFVVVPTLAGLGQSGGR